MKKISLVVAALLLSTVVNAKNATLCLKVDDENNPKVTLSGRYMKHYNQPFSKEQRQEGMRSWDGDYLKLDESISIDSSSGCAYFKYIPVLTEKAHINAHYNQHVTIFGELGRFGSALAVPPVFLTPQIANGSH